MECIFCKQKLKREKASLLKNNGNVYVYYCMYCPGKKKLNNYFSSAYFAKYDNSKLLSKHIRLNNLLKRKIVSIDIDGDDSKASVSIISVMEDFQIKIEKIYSGNASHLDLLTLRSLRSQIKKMLMFC